jgi:CopG family transcriptional regulator, nickel-responsive regulator
MDRFTISLDETLAGSFDDLIRQRGYTTRSEAVRDILRTHLQQNIEQHVDHGICVASLSYVYNHHERELVARLAAIQHAHHELSVSTTHALLDHEERIETVLLKGPSQQVRVYADEILAERGIRHGKLNLIHVEVGPTHSHDGSTHSHLKPRH